MGTLILLLMMAGFMAGVCLGEWRDLVETARDERDMAEVEEWIAELHAAFGEPETARAAA